MPWFGINFQRSFCYPEEQRKGIVLIPEKKKKSRKPNPSKMSRWRTSRGKVSPNAQELRWTGDQREGKGLTWQSGWGTVTLFFLPKSVICIYFSWYLAFKCVQNIWHIWITWNNTARRSKVIPKENQSWIFIGRTDTEAEAPILQSADVKSQFIGKDPDAGKDWGQEEKGVRENEMAGWL